MTPDPATLIAAAYNEYVTYWTVDATRRGACLAVCGRLMAHGYQLADGDGDRVERILAEHASSRDGAVCEEEFGGLVACSLGLAETTT